MLKKMNIRNLTVFPEVSLDFAEGLNVVTGENGSGKSHLLKTAYSVIAASYEEGRKTHSGDPTKTGMQKRYAEKLVHVLRPESLGRLARRKQGRERCELSFFFSDPRLDCGFGFATASKSEVQIDTLPSAFESDAPVFLPTRELLTLFPGFVSMYESRYLEFDETHRDACLLLGAPALKGPRQRRAAGLLETLETAMDGRVILDANGRFYLSIPGQGRMEMTLVAEGLCKLAMVARLIATGSLLDRGYLFWDEPEANLNPRLVKQAARVILELCKNGIQVFIATHSLFLLRELDILSRDPAFEPVRQRYFALHPCPEGVSVEQGDTVEAMETLILLDEELSQSDRYMDAEDAYADD